MSHAAVVHGDDDEEAVVLAALADAAAGVLEHLHRELADVAVRLERLDRRDDDHVSRGSLQRADPAVDLAFRPVIDHVGDVVDRRGQGRRRGLRGGRDRKGEQRQPAGQDEAGHQVTHPVGHARVRHVSTYSHTCSTAAM